MMLEEPDKSYRKHISASQEKNYQELREERKGLLSLFVDDHYVLRKEPKKGPINDFFSYIKGYFNFSKNK